MTTSIGSARFEAPSRVPLQRLRSRYDQVADQWDRTLARLDFFGAYRRLFEREYDSLEPVEAPDILDLGIGTGAAASALLSTLSARQRRVGAIVGADLSIQMLKRAEQRITAEGHHLRSVHSSVEEIPLSDSSFDLVVAAHVLEHAGRPLKAMAEADRVLRPGGRLIIMMTRCTPITLSIQKRWSIQCARSRKLETVLRDFGYEEIRFAGYPGSPVCNAISFCCIAAKPRERGGEI